jgi:competence protein ComEA
MHELLLDRRRVALAAAVLFVLLLLAGRFLLRAHPVAQVPAFAVPSTAPAAGRLYVDVVGAVRRPGLYRLPQGARIADALARAGGTTRKAQVELVNLAAPVADGQQVVVPRKQPVGGSVSPGSPAPAGPVHLNTATLEQLDELPGVGPVTAQKILDFRQQHGAFSSVDELDAIPGIGPARLDQLRDLVAP